MKSLAYKLILITVAFASSLTTAETFDSRLDRVHALFETYCSYYGHDQVCGGEEANLRNGQQRQAREHIEEILKDWSQNIVASADYVDVLKNLNSLYSQADEAKRRTIRTFAVSLNGAWIAQYKDLVDDYLTRSVDEDGQATGLAWTLFAVASTVSPEFKSLPRLNKFLRSQIPWALFAGALKGALTYRSLIHRQEQLNGVVPPPFYYLTFGEQDEPGNDQAAQMKQREFLATREIVKNNSGLLAVLAAGPSLPAFKNVTGLGRLVFYARWASSATRVTIMSALIGMTVGELADWTYSWYRFNRLIKDFTSARENSPTIGQELSLAINGLHLLYLGELDEKLRKHEEAMALLLDEENSDEQVREQFMSYALNDPFFMQFIQDPTATQVDNFVRAQRRIYKQFAAGAEKLASYLEKVPVSSSLKEAVRDRRVHLLRDQAARALAADSKFPLQEISQRLLKVFKRRQLWGGQDEQ